MSSAHDAHAAVPRSLPTGTAATLPSAEQLRDATDIQLTTLLFQAFRVLRVASPPCDLVQQDFVDELLSPSLLRSSTLDTAQLVACLLCDCIRLHVAGAATLAGVDARTELPFPASRCKDVLACLVQPFQSMMQESTHGQAHLDALPSSHTTNDNISTGVATPARTLQPCEYIIERMSASHVMRHLLPPCLTQEQESACQDTPVQPPRKPNCLIASFAPAATVATLLQCLFDVVLYVSDTPHSASSSSTAMAVTAAEMARVLVDVLGITNCITVEQARPLIQTLVRASPTLQAGQDTPLSFTHSSHAANSSGHTNSEDSADKLVQRRSVCCAATIAARVCVEHLDIFQPALQLCVMDDFARGVEDVCSAETAVGEASRSVAATTSTTSGAMRESAKVNPSSRYDRRRRGLCVMAQCMETTVAMMEVHVALVAHVLPRLLPYLTHDVVEVRLLTRRGLGAALGAAEGAWASYRAVILPAMLAGFVDVKPAVRIEMLQWARRWMTAAVARRWRVTAVTEAWQSLRWQLCQRLTDVHAGVRRQGVLCYGAIVLAAPRVCLDSVADVWAQSHRALTSAVPSRVQADGTTGPGAAGAGAGGGHAADRGGNPAELPGACVVSVTSLRDSLGLRVGDKNARVREAAVEVLSAIYRQHPLRWIPDVILSAVRAEGGAAMVEWALEQMLPQPLETAATSRAWTRHATLPPPCAPGGTAAAASSAFSTTRAVFDFEQAEEESAAREGGVSGRDYVSAWVQLCADCSESSFATLLTLCRKKVQLRGAVVRLFELRTEDSRGEHSAQRLLRFLGRITHTDSGSSAIAAMAHAANKRNTTTVTMTSSTGDSHHPPPHHRHEGESNVKTPWDVLWSARDGHVREALCRACEPAEENWATARAELARALRGRVDAGTHAFVHQRLACSLMLPLQRAHVVTLMDRLAAVLSPDWPAASASCPSSDHGSDSVALAQSALRALHLFVVHSPSYARRCEPLLFALLHRVARMPCGGVTPSRGGVGAAHKTAMLLSLFAILHAWAQHTRSMARQPTPAVVGSDALATTADRGGVHNPRTGMHTLRLLCLGDADGGTAAGSETETMDSAAPTRQQQRRHRGGRRAAAHTASATANRAPASGSADRVLAGTREGGDAAGGVCAPSWQTSGVIAKHAARCLLALRGVEGWDGVDEVLGSMVHTLRACVATAVCPVTRSADGPNTVDSHAANSRDNGEDNDRHDPTAPPRAPKAQWGIRYLWSTPDGRNSHHAQAHAAAASSSSSSSSLSIDAGASERAARRVLAGLAALRVLASDAVWGERLVGDADTHPPSASSSPCTSPPTAARMEWIEGLITLCRLTVGPATTAERAAARRGRESAAGDAVEQSGESDDASVSGRGRVETLWRFGPGVPWEGAIFDAAAKAATTLTLRQHGPFTPRRSKQQTSPPAGAGAQTKCARTRNAHRDAVARGQLARVWLSLHAQIVHCVSFPWAATATTAPHSTNVLWPTPHATGACQRRRTLATQLIQLVTRPTNDLAVELAVSAMLSSEESAPVRESVQRKLTARVRRCGRNRLSCPAPHSATWLCTGGDAVDMRVVAMLFMMAMSTDSRAGYATLRRCVATVGDAVVSSRRGVASGTNTAARTVASAPRAAPAPASSAPSTTTTTTVTTASNTVMLASPAAMFGYLEYTLPFLVLFLAHHPRYARESGEGQWMGSQRVWHLVMTELLRHGLDCAVVVAHILAQIKMRTHCLYMNAHPTRATTSATTSAADATAHAEQETRCTDTDGAQAARVVCDLGCRVLLECVGAAAPRSGRVVGAGRDGWGGAEMQWRVAGLRESIASVYGAGAAYAGNANRNTAEDAAAAAAIHANLNNGANPKDCKDHEQHSNDVAAAAAAVLPMALLMPSFLVPATPALARQRWGTVYLDAGFRVSATAPFRLTPAAAAAGAAAAGAGSANDKEEEEGAVRALVPQLGLHQQQQQQRREEQHAIPSSDLSSLAHATSASVAGKRIRSVSRSRSPRHGAVDAVLDEMFVGLRRCDMAALPWKPVRERIVAALRDLPPSRAEESHTAMRRTDSAGQSGGMPCVAAAAAAAASSAVVNVEEMLRYAKEQLRVRYDRATA